MAKRDHYKTLGVPKTATDKEIKRRYKVLAKKYHPDRNPDDPSAEAKFKAVQEAYNVLGDAKKRAEYDQFGDAAVGGVHVGRGGQQVYQWGGGSSINVDDLQDLMSAFGGGGGGRRADIFDELFGHRGGARAAQPPPQPGSDSVLPITLSFEQAVKGATVSVTLRSRNNGRSETIDVKIPAGVEDGQRIRIKGRGPSGASGGPPGDLFLVCTIKPHPELTRRGADLETVVTIDVTTAVLGGKADVPCLDGRTTVTIPPGTPSGTRLRLKGRGVKVQGRSQPGDQFVVVRIVPKRSLTAEERRLYEKLRDLDHGTRRSNETSPSDGDTPS